MNPGPGTSWPDLHYVETEQVQLDVAAIIARGTRMRRKRLIAKVAVLAAVAGIAPTVVVIDMGSPVTHRSVAAPSRSDSPTFGTMNPVPGVENGPEHSAHVAAPPPAETKYATRPMVDLFDGAGSVEPAAATVRRAVTLSRRYGPMLAIAGARGASGVWFAATASQLTLFRLSVTGAMKSWPLPASASSVRSAGSVALAVTATGVAWVSVASTVYRLDTKTAQVSSWPVPVTALAPSAIATSARSARLSARQPAPAYPDGDSLAVSPDGHVAVVLPHASSVQVLDPRSGRFRQIRMTGGSDQPLAVGYARNGTLGIAFAHLGQRPAAGVLLVKRSGAELSAPVTQPTSVSAFGASGLLVGITRPVVVSAQGKARPLVLPADTDTADVRTQPAALPGNRLGIAMDAAITTFPATAASVTVASAQSQLWVIPPPRCRSRGGCPRGFGLMTTDAAGDMWVVPAADQRTVDLISLG